MSEPTITEPNSSTIDAIVKILADCQSILFITGAGVSADSGVPTYRGIGGLYNVDTTPKDLQSKKFYPRRCLLGILR